MIIPIMMNLLTSTVHICLPPSTYMYRSVYHLTIFKPCTSMARSANILCCWALNLSTPPISFTIASQPYLPVVSKVVMRTFPRFYVCYGTCRNCHECDCQNCRDCLFHFAFPCKRSFSLSTFDILRVPYKNRAFQNLMYLATTLSQLQISN